jgi:hypothetical protein
MLPGVGHFEYVARSLTLPLEAITLVFVELFNEIL